MFCFCKDWKKLKYVILKFFLLLIFLFLIFQIVYYLRIKFAKVEIILTDTLEVEFLEKKKVSDFIDHINGKILSDYEISTTKVGKQDISFRFINDDGIRLKYTFQIEVIDTVAPLIFL